MFNKIFIEKDLLHNSHAVQIMSKFPKIQAIEIDSLDHYFGRYKKPYLQKRDNLNLYIAAKKGKLVKEAPLAYGLGHEPHYYYVHAYNCIYECDYCYLQGYFHSPDIVFFVNHDDILSEMENVIRQHPKDQAVWFHAGEYSDSLALSHLTNELSLYFDFFKKHPNAYLELRTKSVNIRSLIEIGPINNVVVSFSLSPLQRTIENDLKTPPLGHRLKAIEKLHQAGFKIGLHFDPIIYEDHFKHNYQKLIQQIDQIIPLERAEYLSLGVVRFTKDVFHQVQKNYPESILHAQEFVTSFDNKVRYNRPMRLWMLQTIKDLAIQAGLKSEKIYFCMERED